MRVWRALAAVLCLLALSLFGFMALLAGFAEQHAANHTYHVNFARPGADCGSGAQNFDVDSGAPLGCGPPGAIAASADTDFPGFTDGQNTQVAALAARLGADGLQDYEQQAIQHLVDRLATTVPDSDRPHYDEGVSMGPLWGTRLIVAGAISWAIVALSYLVYRLRSRRRTPAGGLPASRPAQ